MLDLAFFHTHKVRVCNARHFEIDDDLLVEKMKMLINSFQQAASYNTVTAGAVFYPPCPCNYGPIVRISIDFATPITYLSRSKKEKAQICEKPKGKSETETRVNLEDMDINVYWENKNI